jgi:hypothetical protein
MNKKQPTGKTITFLYTSNVAAVKDVQVKVHYELYDGLPLVVKWISVENRSSQIATIAKPVNEVLALVEEESAVVGTRNK